MRAKNARVDEFVTKHAHDIAQIRLPMVGNPMRYINAYALRDDDGLTLVDCGWKADDVRVALDAGLAEIDASLADVRRLLVTHAHFDHYGLAASLRRAGVPTLYMHEADDYFASRMLEDPIATDRIADEWIARNGFRTTGSLEDDVHYNRTEYAEPTHRVEDGERIGRLRAVYTPGHTPGHLCFVDERSGKMLTGDHVLARVTPHVGTWFEPTHDQLGDYVASLKKVAAMGAAGALPAHGEPFEDLAGRANELLAHHDERERQIVIAFGGAGRNATEIADAIGWTKRETPFRELAEAHQQFAVAETIAHLEHLRARDYVRATDDGTTIVYELLERAAALAQVV
jgi:glyoxylase-like metal-dependent hydrolase (beta-lactamase superfamily II)